MVLPLVAHAQEPIAPEDVQLAPQGGAAADGQASASVSLGGGADATATGGAATAAPAAPAAAEPEAAEEKEEKVAGGPMSDASVGGPVTDEADSWKFGYSGFFRAPMRIGIGERAASQGQKPPTTKVTGDSKRSDMTLHSPVIPDDQYLSWQHTNHSSRDWAELFLSYGNSWAKGTVAIQGFNFVDASYADPSANFGVGQAWVTITPYMPFENMRLEIKGGNFWGRYGMAGKYDAGEYDTFLFGRTHTMGEAVRLEVDNGDMTLGFEQGFGTKRPDPSLFNKTRFTLLHHEHADLTYNGPISMKFGLHFLDAWTQSEQPLTTDPGVPAVDGAIDLGNQQPDGNMMVFGADARFDLANFGYLWFGASHIIARDAITVAPAIEVIHSYGGGEYQMGITGNYLDSSQCIAQYSIAGGGPLAAGCSGGNGSITTLALQYEVQATSLAQGAIFGEGRELTAKLYGMVNLVKSHDAAQDGINKKKFGTDLLFDLFPIMGIGTRFDYLMPNSDYSKQNFGIISPRLVFRSNLVTHEQIALEYSRYIYSQRMCQPGMTPADLTRTGYDPREVLCVQPPTSTVAPDGFGSSVEATGTHATTTYIPDVNVVKIIASMWW